MNGYKTVITLILTVVLVAGIIGCGGQAEEPIVAPPDPTSISAPDTIEEEPLLDPEAVTQAFYDWYLAYTETGNPLVDKAYHDSPYLTADLVSQVDEILAGFEGGGYDPFLCAQDIPGAIEAAGSWEAWQEESGGEAAVNVSQIWNPGSDFESVRDMMVYLVTVDGRWLINEIVCPLPAEAYPQTPDAVVMAFYNWYLDYAASGNPAGNAKAFYTWYLAYAETGNPLVDGVYRDSDFLSAAFIAKVDEIIAGFDQGGFDPFLLAQDVPTAFAVDPGYLEDTALVDLSFGPQSVKMIQVNFVRENGRLLIDDIVEAVPPGAMEPGVDMTGPLSG